MGTRGVGSLSACRALQAELEALPGKCSGVQGTPTTRLAGTGVLGDAELDGCSMCLWN